MTRVVCVDFGSTFTKVALVDLDAGELVGTAQHRTTIDSDVLDGYDACLAALATDHPGVDQLPALACSSAGGGLRIAVLGNEALVTAEAGRRVALSSGGKVVHVGAGRLDAAGLAALDASEPDVLLLTGGTDGGDEDVLLHNATSLGAECWRTPVVVGGNVETHERVAHHLADGGTPFVLADNVVPRIGVLAPESARRAIREVFLDHVIGGKHLSTRTTATGRRFADLVLGA
ncbi:MAG TPA: glutamate mutase L, partial [Marmoricola sp.]|nr:glutamate mutase L [Marmoricola sp.]